MRNKNIYISKDLLRVNKPLLLLLLLFLCSIQGYSQEYRIHTTHNERAGAVDGEAVQGEVVTFELQIKSAPTPNNPNPGWSSLPGNYVCNSYVWTFSGGRTPSGSTTFPSLFRQDVIFDSPDPSNFVSVIADGCVGEISENFVVLATPTFSIQASVSNPYRGQLVTFSVNNFLPSADIGKYYFEWDFGDGSPKETTTSTSIGHRFSSTSNKTVSLVARHENQSEDWSSDPPETKVVNVRPVEVTFIANRPAGTSDPASNINRTFSGEPIEYIASVKIDEPNGADVTSEYKFDWTLDVNLVSPNNVSPVKQHTYNTASAPTVNLKARHNFANFNIQTSKNITVKGRNININPSTDSPCPLEEVEFNPKVTDDQGNEDTGFTYAWNFGDGATSNLQNPTHVYDPPSGDKTVELTISFGELDKTEEMTIHTGGSFFVTPCKACIIGEQEVTLMADGIGTADSVNWQIYDGKWHNYSPKKKYTAGDQITYKLKNRGLNRKNNRLFRLIKYTDGVITPSRVSNINFMENIICD